MMRILTNILAAACLLVLAGLLWFKSSRESDEAHRVAETTSAIREIERTLRYKVEYEKLAANARGYPATIDPAWFDDLPRSEIVGPQHPWMEIAPPEQAGLHHPPVRLAVSESLAGLWYNPYQGIIRARVPVQISDAKSVALYNLVNGTSLRSILEPERQVDPSPLASPVEPAPAIAPAPAPRAVHPTFHSGGGHSDAEPCETDS